MNRSLIGRVRHLNPIRLQYLHPNHHCCQLLKSNVWTLLTSLTLKSESATASQSTISSVQKPKNRLSLFESLKRSILKTDNAFLRLDFKKNSLTFVSNTKTLQNGAGEVAEVSYCYYSWASREIVQKFPCMEVAKFTDCDRMFCPRPCANVFRHCALQRVNGFS